MALIDPSSLILKDGRRIVVRCAQESDALAVLEGARTAFRDGGGMIVDPDEFTTDEEGEKKWIRSLNENPKELLLVAECDGVIIGNIDFHIARRRRLAHSGEFGMNVHPDWRNCGVGNALLEALLTWARSVPEIEKITLHVRADNPRAIALYRKHGFIQCGTAKEAIKMPGGTYVDNIAMETFVRS